MCVSKGQLLLPSPSPYCHLTQEEIASRAERFLSKKTSLQQELQTVHVSLYSHSLCKHIQWSVILAMYGGFPSCQRTLRITCLYTEICLCSRSAFHI